MLDTMNGKRLSEIRHLFRTYRPTADPDRQGELLTAAQDLFDPARRGMRLESALKRWLVGKRNRDAYWVAAAEIQVLLEAIGDKQGDATDV